jgi:hypothetical protein
MLVEFGDHCQAPSGTSGGAATDATWAIETNPDLRRALMSIEPRARAALVLTVLDGYTQDEVAGAYRVNEREAAPAPAGSPGVSPLAGQLLAQLGGHDENGLLGHKTSPESRPSGAPKPDAPSSSRTARAGA